MLLSKEKILFIHIPKTAGNAIASSFIERSNSDVAKIPRKGNPPDRFGISDPTGLDKHTTLAKYAEAIDPQLFSVLTAFAVYRPAHHRLLSLYYSPHRWIGKTPRFSVRAFWALVKNSFSLDEMISLGGESKPKAFIILNFGKLDSGLIELERVIGDSGLAKGSLTLQRVNSTALSQKIPWRERLFALIAVIISKHRRDAKWSPGRHSAVCLHPRFPLSRRKFRRDLPFRSSWGPRNGS